MSTPGAILAACRHESKWPDTRACPDCVTAALADVEAQAVAMRRALGFARHILADKRYHDADTAIVRAIEEIDAALAKEAIR